MKKPNGPIFGPKWRFFYLSDGFSEILVGSKGLILVPRRYTNVFDESKINRARVNSTEYREPRVHSLTCNDSANRV